MNGRVLNRVQAKLFDVTWLASYLARLAGRTVLRRKYRRTASADEYEATRRRYLEDFRRSNPSLDSFLVAEADTPVEEQYTHLLKGTLLYGSIEEATRRTQQCVVAAIGSYEPDSVMEFGCGVGRNLLAIKRAYPDIRCVGLELTPASVQLARLAASRYRLPLDIISGDITRPLPELEGVSVCFSVHALEQIPDSRFAFEQMYRLAEKAVVLFEPIVELYHFSLRGLAARLRARHLDRLRGLYPYILAKGY